MQYYKTFMQYYKTFMQYYKIFMQYYKTLWTDANYEEREWNSSTYNDDMITLDELKRF
jgi:hypothetical protein